ncbi:TPA: hypothetical protein ACM5WF_002054, partial [Neisseria gonorrhoeae]
VLGKIATIRRMPSPQPSPTGEGVGFGRFFGCRRFERQLRFAAVVSGRLKNKKQPAQPVFLAANLNPNSRPVLSPCGRELARGQQAARLVLGQLGCWERLPQLGKCPLPGPPPRGRGQVAADFAVAGGLKNRLDLQPLISGRLKSKNSLHNLFSWNSALKRV